MTTITDTPQLKYDSFMELACDATGTDLTPHFEAYDAPVSQDAKSYCSTKAPLTRDIWLIDNAEPIWYHPGDGEGGYYREYWTGISGTDLASLINHADFPANPNGSETVNTGLEGPRDWDDNYGQRLRAFIHAPVSGAYRFWLSGNNSAKILLSTDENPVNASTIIELTESVGNYPSTDGYRMFDFYKMSVQRSAEIELEAGKKYYIEVLHKESGWKDNVSVAWNIPATDELPGETRKIVAAQYLTPFVDANHDDIPDDHYSLTANQWHLISLPRDPGTSNTVADLFSDDLTSTYWNDWILWSRIKGSSNYAQLTLNSVMNQGEGYWIYSLDPSFIDIPGTPTPVAADGYYEIPLSKAGSEEGSFLYNQLGNPFDYSVAWADVKVRVTSGTTITEYSLPDAENADYVSRVGYVYNGNTWAPLDSTTPGFDEVALKEFDGFLLKVLGGAISATYDSISLLIPAQANVVSETPSASTFPVPAVEQSFVQALAESSLELASKVSSFFVGNAQASEKPSKRAAKKDKYSFADGWYVRLIAKDHANNLVDSSNVLGQLPDSMDGYDTHDLVELDPMSSDYLTIVFPHYDWDELSGDYTSDFHGLKLEKSKPAGKDSWQFEVLTNDPERSVTLSWEGLPEILKRSRLIDNVTGEVIKVGKETNYTFTMGDTSRSFTWKMKK